MVSECCLLLVSDWLLRVCGSQVSHICGLMERLDQFVEAKEVLSVLAHSVLAQDGITG